MIIKKINMNTNRIWPEDSQVSYLPEPLMDFPQIIPILRQTVIDVEPVHTCSPVAVRYSADLGSSSRCYSYWWAVHARSRGSTLLRGSLCSPILPSAPWRRDTSQSDKATERSFLPDRNARPDTHPRWHPLLVNYCWQQVDSSNLEINVFFV